MEAQGLREKGTQHPLPWYPPTCVPLAAIPDGREWVDRLPSVKERDKAPDKLPDRSMKHVSSRTSLPCQQRKISSGS